VQERTGNSLRLRIVGFRQAVLRETAENIRQIGMPATASGAMNQKKQVVLVVEDEPLIRLNTIDALEEEGYAVAEAENAEAALKVLEARSDVRLLFTDVHMPGALDGMALARQVHARWPHILLIITSGRRRPNRAEIPDDGRFLAKPYRAKQLVSEVNGLLQRNG
jgi:two-component system, response regulator PdtaR